MLPILFCKVMLPKIDTKKLLSGYPTLQPQFCQRLVPHGECARFSDGYWLPEEEPYPFLAGVQSLFVNAARCLPNLIKNPVLSLFSLLLPIRPKAIRNCPAEVGEMPAKVRVVVFKPPGNSAHRRGRLSRPQQFCFQFLPDLLRIQNPVALFYFSLYLD